jgi:hypothetical protein
MPLFLLIIYIERLNIKIGNQAEKKKNLIDKTKRWYLAIRYLRGELFTGGKSENHFPSSPREESFRDHL